ncbi:MAG: bacteriochlorophyll 4-vinyl reductase [Pseudomonadota bacterium]
MTALAASSPLEGAASAPSTSGAPRGVIGPNAVLQLDTALLAMRGAEARWAVFAAAGCEALIDDPPRAMIDEAIPARLFAALFRLRPRDATEIAAEAGRLTGDYIAANRIPAFARALLPRLPRRFSARILLAAIRRHSWTFAGSGLCATGQAGERLFLRIEGNPMALPCGCWHRAVIERLFQRLVTPAARVRKAPVEGDAPRTDHFLISL